MKEKKCGSTEIREYEKQAKMYDYTHLLNVSQEYIDMLNETSNNNEYKFIALFVTDIIKNGTYVYYSQSAEQILSRAFDVEIYQGHYFEGILSRKLQLLPAILNVMK